MPKNMLNRLKKFLSKSDSDNLPQKERNNPSTSGIENVDPRLCGLIDAVKRGWYQQEIGELYKGFKITREDIVLDVVGCGE
jgi:hypothetical protein